VYDVSGKKTFTPSFDIKRGGIKSEPEIRITLTIQVDQVNPRTDSFGTPYPLLVVRSVPIS
jgi:hypothetical protein